MYLILVLLATEVSQAIKPHRQKHPISGQAIVNHKRMCVAGIELATRRSQWV